MRFDPQDGGGPRQYTGVSFIVTVLNMHFAHLDEEEASRSMLELCSLDEGMVKLWTLT